MNYEEYEDLNKAKRIILQMMQTKYGDNDEEYEEEQDTDADKQMTNIIKYLTDATTSSFQMIPFLKVEKTKTKPVAIGQKPRLDRNGNEKTNKNGEVLFDYVYEDQEVEGNTYYRNVNALLSFNQQTLNLSNALTNLNRIFKNLIQDIGYVEPSTIGTYNKIFDKFGRVFEELKDIAVVQGKLKIIAKDGEQNEFEKKNLIHEFQNALLENDELIKYDNMVRHNYNYKNNNMTIKKSTYTKSNNTNNDDYEDDDE